MTAVTMPALHDPCARAAAAGGAMAWTAERHDAATVAASPLPRWLHVHAGRAWVTAATPSRDGTPPADHWLGAGASLALPPGSRWIVETWPGTRLAIVEDAATLLGRRPVAAARTRVGRTLAAA